MRATRAYGLVSVVRSPFLTATGPLISRRSHHVPSKITFATVTLFSVTGSVVGTRLFTPSVRVIPSLPAHMVSAKIRGRRKSFLHNRPRLLSFHWLLGLTFVIVPFLVHQKRNVTRLGHSLLLVAGTRYDQPLGRNGTRPRREQKTSVWGVEGYPKQGEVQGYTNLPRKVSPLFSPTPARRADATRSGRPTARAISTPPTSKSWRALAFLVRLRRAGTPLPRSCAVSVGWIRRPTGAAAGGGPVRRPAFSTGGSS